MPICIKYIFTSNCNERVHKTAQSKENNNEIINKTDYSSSELPNIPKNFDPIPKFDRDEFVFQLLQNNSDGSMVNLMKSNLNTAKQLN